MVMKIAAARFLALAIVAWLLAGSAQAQLFGRSDDRRQQDEAGELTVRLERLEGQLRQMTGTIEELQYKNQQLEQQLRAMQGGGASSAGPRPQGTGPGPGPGLSQGSINQPPNVQSQISPQSLQPPRPPPPSLQSQSTPKSPPPPTP